ncbi:hypothetical protein K6I34_006962, partial [Streptomyces sp. UNOC14_S4]|nr:hypothetical protein [Streptomyces sp. UNOC14_S4]
LPFDRTGEEELRFVGFGHLLVGHGHHGHGHGQYGGYGYGHASHAGQAAYHGQSGYTAAWDAYYGRQRGVAAALPPAPRDGRLRGY